MVVRTSSVNKGDMSEEKLKKTHVVLAGYHACTLTTFAILSGVWRDSTYDVTFNGDFKFNFRLLAAVAVNEGLMMLYHLLRYRESPDVDEKGHFARVLASHTSMTIMSLAVQHTSGATDLLLGIATIGLWGWRGETYAAYEKGTDDDGRSKLVSTAFAAAIPISAFCAVAEDASVLRSMLFGFLVTYILINSVLHWVTRNRDSDPHIRMTNAFTDSSFSAMFAYTSLVLVYKYDSV